jgi:hypothetical protein
MSLFEQAAERSSGDAADWARRTDQHLREQRRSATASVALEATARRHADSFDAVVLERLLAADTPPLGVYGTGLYRVGERFLPALFVMPELVGARELKSISVQHAKPGVPAVTLLGRLNLDVPPDGLVVAMPLPSEEAVSVHCDMWGTLGIPVWLADGRKGILTAGHVASTLGAAPTVDGKPIGTVIYRNHRKLHRSPETSADVSAIALSEDGVQIVGSAPYQAIGSAIKLHRARALGRSQTNPAGDLIRSVHISVAVDTFGEWEDIATVDAAISIPGDSGAAVLDDDDEVIGQIVGGHPPAYSLVQNVELLFRDSKTTFRR